MADHPDDKRKDASAPADDPTAGGDRTAVLPAGGDRTATLATADKRTATFDAPAPVNAPTPASTPAPARASVPASGDDDITFVRSAGEDVGEDATIIRPRTRGRPRLIVCDPAGGTREFPLTAPDVAIGRAATCGIVLANPEVSRLHARVVAQGEEHALIPVGARRNTYVNGEAATAERLLRHGDVIQLASERLVYCESEDLPAAAVAGSPVASAGVPKAALAGAAAVAVALALYFLLGRGEPPAPPPVPATIAPAAPARPQPPPAAPAQNDGAAERAGAPGESAAAAPAVAPEAQRAAQLEKLLYQADIAFLEKKYTSPPEGSAVFAYREVLKLDPTNERARTRVAVIVDQYLGWAEAALRERDRNRARLYADKAAYVHEQVPEAGNKEAIGRRLDALARALGTARAPAP